MAGNIVKWWKHKILGGYKQFSVQECTTDSEELMYHQVRAPSSCSAPPDLLLVSDRENNIPLKSPVVNIITATTAATTSSSSQRQQHQQHHATKDLFSKNAQNTKISSNKNSSKLVNMQATTTQQQQQNEANQQQQQHQQPPHQQSRQHGKEEPRIHLEEFTCDVSVEGGKSSQPLQFSFTFYDLDGHHGKITKDDIVGIVYTIYESIGKSVVVPHCGSKTINVRLTVSPEGKSKATANKLKKMQPSGMPLTENCKATATTTTTSAAQAGHSRRQHRYRPRKLIKSDDEDDDSTSEKDLQLTAMAAVAASATANKSKSHASKYNNRMKLEQQQQQQQLTTAANNCCQSTENNRNSLENNVEMTASSCQHDNLYENMATNLKCCTTKDTKKCDSPVVTEECRGCAGNIATTTAATTAGVQQKTTDMYLKQASSRVKMLRKARKQKYQDHCFETRQRSLSVGSETCWKSRHTKNSIHLMETLATRTQQPLHHHQLIQPGEDVIDGVQLRNPHRMARPNTLAATNRSSAECWKTALNRNDLISIIRESMEKNRLCFQLNGKPQASVSPIRQSQQRQRSNTVSKIPTLIANHNNFITNCNNSIHQHATNNSPINNESNIHDSNTSCQPQQPPHQHQHPQHHPPHHSHHHPQPHIPIYHQQMAINPAVLAAQNGIVHSKMNLCGYDSFLHATICGGGTSHSPPPLPPANINTIAAHTQQPVATVQPIMNAINAAAAVPNSHQQQHSHYQVPSPRIYAHPITTTQQQIKTSKILRSGTFSQTHHHVATTKSTPVVQQSTPHYHGYHRLASTTASATKHNLAALNLQNPSMAKAQVEHLEKWLHEREQCPQKSKKDFKNYDNLLFAKLTEKLQDSTLNAESEKQRQEIGQRRKQRAHMKAQKRSGTADCADLYDSVVPSTKIQLQPQSEMIVSPVTSEQSNYATLIPINGDPIECENLLGNQTTDDETSVEVETPTTATQANVNLADVSVVKESATADLLNFNDDGIEAGADVLVVDAIAGTGRNSSNSNSSGAAVVAAGAVSAANNSSTASLIHRYVHEHIHHHYHHFEDKEENIYE